MPRIYVRKSLEQRFHEAVIKGPECWGWKRAIKDGNYPALALVRGKTMKRASHLSWEMAHGQIPDGLCVLHKCDNRICTNPDHLFLGTRADNQADMASKDRSAWGERARNAKLTTQQVLEIKSLVLSGSSQRSIARRFNVNQCNISRIVSGKRWRRMS